MNDFPRIFDSSMIATYKTCPALANYTYVQNWKPKETSVHLHAGAAFAKGLEVAREEFYVNGRDSSQAIASGLGALMRHYGDYDAGESPKSLARMMGAFEFYFDNYPLSHDDQQPITLASGRRGIEFSFAEPLPLLHPQTAEPLLYCGRMDAILNYAGGVYICDEKTTTQLGPTWARQWDLRAQFTGYAWACHRAGIRVDGAIVRGVSILKSRYDTAMAVMQRPEWQITRWYEELLMWIERWMEDWKRGKYLHNFDHACGDYGGCAFRSACLSQDEKPWLETYFERRYWDPILRVEEKIDETR
jgi:hypothetical protein